MRESVRIGGVEVQPGERLTIDLPVARLQTHAELTMPVQVLHAAEPGPTLFVSAAMHGDEINGIEIISRLLQRIDLSGLQGTLIVVPIVNVYGFINQSRYLPDRRDLNRFFPGAEKGSLASRLAWLLMTEIVPHCTHGIGLHTGSQHRSNLPQIRVSMTDPEARRLARAFGAPVMLNSTLRKGSLRAELGARDVPMLVYEAGEALRFDDVSIRVGVEGILAVMRTLGMLPTSGRPPAPINPLMADSSTWVRAPISGILRSRCALGHYVEDQSALGTIGDPFGEHAVRVVASADGLVIGCQNLPLVYEGDALFHLARFDESADVEGTLVAFKAELERQTEVESAEPLSQAHCGQMPLT